MNLYLLTQDSVEGYDTFDSAVVAAPSEDAARCTHPVSYYTGDLSRDCWIDEPKSYAGHDEVHGWPGKPSEVTVRLIGTAVEDTKAGVICASYNAG